MWIYYFEEYSWFVPWENTVAYYPLTSTDTINDMKWHWTAYNLTNRNISFWTYQWVDCAYFNSANSVSWLYYQNTQIIPNSSFTWSCRLYKISNSTDNPRLCSSYSWNPYWILMNNSWNIVCWTTSSTDGYNIPGWERHNRVITWSFTNWTYKLYKDGVLVKQWSWSWYSNWVWLNIWWLDSQNSSSRTSDKFNWYMSKWILENIIWTDDVIMDNYLADRHLYWIN